MYQNKINIIKYNKSNIAILHCIDFSPHSLLNTNTSSINLQLSQHSYFICLYAPQKRGPLVFLPSSLLLAVAVNTQRYKQQAETHGRIRGDSRAAVGSRMACCAGDRTSQAWMMECQRGRQSWRSPGVWRECHHNLQEVGPPQGAYPHLVGSKNKGTGLYYYIGITGTACPVRELAKCALPSLSVCFYFYLDKIIMKEMINWNMDMLVGLLECEMPHQFCSSGYKTC